jgi:hypothetical protein
MSEPPGHGHLDRTKDIVPGGIKRFSDFLPGKASCPTGQKPSIGCCQMIFPLSPRNQFYLYPAARTVNSARGVEKEHGNTPEGDKLETALGQGVVSWTTPVASGAERSTSTTGRDFDIRKRLNNPTLRRPADMLRSPQKQGGLYARQFHSF